VSVAEDSSVRPVRINFSGIVFRLDVDEAIELANQLVDNAETVKAQERKQS
jgi:hypothetical protein